MARTVKKNKSAGRYKYADIAAVHEWLEEQGYSYYQYTDRLGEDDYIMTVRIMDGEEKPPLRGARIVDASLVGVDNPAQEQGSAITYARRYSLLMAFGLATEDNDAQTMAINRSDKATPNQVAYIRRSVERSGKPIEGFLKSWKVSSIEELTKGDASKIIEKIKSSFIQEE